MVLEDERQLEADKKELNEKLLAFAKEQLAMKEHSNEKPLASQEEGNKKLLISEADADASGASGDAVARKENQSILSSL